MGNFYSFYLSNNFHTEECCHLYSLEEALGEFVSLLKITLINFVPSNFYFVSVNNLFKQTMMYKHFHVLWIEIVTSHIF